MAILQNTTVSGSLVITGDLTARQFILSSSVTFYTESFSSGSTRFGDSIDDTMTVTGSLRLTGSLAATGSATFRVNADRNLAIKYDTNIALSAQNDAGNPESVRYYADTFRIYTATTAVGLAERLIVTNTGNVGIGVTNPATYAGGLAVSGSVVNSIARVALSVLGINNGLHIGDDLTDAVMGPLNSGTKTHILSRAGGVFTRALTIDSAGYIGVNNSSPATRLHVVTTAGATKAYDDISKTNIMVFDNTSMESGVGGSITFGGYKTSTTNGGNFAAIDGVKENGTAGNEAGMFRVWTSNSSGIFGERLRISSAGASTFRANSDSVFDLLTLYNISGTSSGTRLRFQNGFGDLGAVRVLQMDNGSLADDGQLELQTAQNASLSTKMTITNAGSIGAPSGTNIYNASDIRLKRNIETITDGLSKVSALRPVKFNWIEGFELTEENKDMLGFIAQEVQNIIPEAVENFGNNNITVGDTVIENSLRVNEKFIIPVLVKAIQELSAKVTALENK